MSQIVVRARGIGKRYHLGRNVQRYRTLGERLTSAAAAPIRRLRQRAEGTEQTRGPREFWALKDVDFEIAQGDVVGFVGRNGAGKSTLLKILSRITEPTEGRIELTGRVGSLLEVGTGFHPELTGRENVFLNGAILGMTRYEIARKFDEIVAFAEIEKFIDTPVKHYSSGMYVRLAFAVAAHLEPEILIVDEVLSVGDAAFQRKCLGKMNDVAGQGRTVLFVSHNMSAVQSLCTRALVLEAGRVVIDATPYEAVRSYLERVGDAILEPIATRRDRKGDGSLRFTDFWLEDENGERITQAVVGAPVRLCGAYTTDRPTSRIVVSYTVGEEPGNALVNLNTEDSGAEFDNLPPEGVITCAIEKLPLVPGRYFGSVFARVNGEIADWIDSAFMLDVIDGDFHGTGKMIKMGKFLVQQKWDLHASEALIGQTA